jgi:hypothetical protein
MNSYYYYSRSALSEETPFSIVQLNRIEAHVEKMRSGIEATFEKRGQDSA